MRYLIGFIASIISILGNINAEIYHCTKMEEILPHFNEMTGNSMAVVDLDDTLVTKADKALRPVGNDLRTGYYFRMMQRFRFDHLLYLVSLVEKQAKPELVDSSWPSVIAHLQEITPLVIAHTAAPPKKVGIFESFPQQRKELLHTFGIDFSPAKEIFQDVELLELNHIPYVSPVIFNGMLFSENYAKGEALVTLLKHYHVKPDLVVFVDDTYNNLRSVERELKKLGIRFIGIHYEEETLFNDTIDEPITEVQYYYLVEKEQWLSDEEARVILERDGLPTPKEDEEIVDDSNEDNNEIWSF